MLTLLMVHASLFPQTSPVPPTDAGADARSALRAERQQQSKALDAQEQACYQRFFTNTCIDEVARTRRAMLADLRRKEAALDAADRQQRAQEQIQRKKEKLQAHEAQLQSLDATEVDRAEREKQTERDAKLRNHAARAASASATPVSKGKASILPSGPSAQERAANQAAFDKKQAESKRRLAERARAAAAAASATASAASASAPRSLPLPKPPVPEQ